MPNISSNSYLVKGWNSLCYYKPKFLYYAFYFICDVVIHYTPKAIIIISPPLSSNPGSAPACPQVGQWLWVLSMALFKEDIIFIYIKIKGFALSYTFHVHLKFSHMQRRIDLWIISSVFFSQNLRICLWITLSEESSTARGMRKGGNVIQKRRVGLPSVREQRKNWFGEMKGVRESDGGLLRS